MASRQRGKKTEMNFQSLDLNAISFVLFHSASEPSKNFSNSKQAYHFLSCYGNVDINFAILFRMSKGRRSSDLFVVNTFIQF